MAYTGTYNEGDVLNIILKILTFYLPDGTEIGIRILCALVEIVIAVWLVWVFHRK